MKEGFLGTVDKFFPNPRTPEDEHFRASMGFDFIFYKDYKNSTRISCIEINGHNSGISGSASIDRDIIDPSIRTLADIRSQKSTNNILTLRDCEDVRIQLREYVAGNNDIQNSELKQRVLEYSSAWEKSNSIPIFDTAFPNHPALEITLNDKRYHKRIVPDVLRPRERWGGDFGFPESGIWLAKPALESTGNGIKAYKKSEFKGKELPPIEEGVVWQEFLQPLPAQLAPGHLKDHPASLRYLIDFVTYGDGHTERLFEFAYNRVSPHSINSDEAFEDIYVVNKSRGAYAVPVSDYEFALTRNTSMSLIKRIGNLYNTILGEYIVSKNRAVDKINDDSAFLQHVVDTINKSIK